MVHVQFTYDERTAKWDVGVVGAKDETEAKQALNAVVLTCRDVVVSMEHKVTYLPPGPYGTASDEEIKVFNITPHVTFEGLLRSGFTE